MERKKVLIAEQDVLIRTAIKRFLEEEGFVVTAMDNGSNALDEYANHWFDLVILDLDLPEIDGWNMISQIREQQNISIIVLSENDEESVKIKAYRMGIDDYILKPFSIEILVAKVKRMIGRTRLNSVLNESNSKIQLGSLTIDKIQQTCYIEGNFIKLTEKEFHLIRYLISNKDKVLSRNEVYNSVWEDSTTDLRIVDVYINKLRDKIKDANVKIYTQFGKGYVLSQKYQ